MTRRIAGDGPVPCLSLWVGLGPGIEELRKGEVWVGPAGRLLTTLSIRQGIYREEIFITNLRKTPIVPGDGGPYIEIEDLELELRMVEPQVVVAMGREAARWFLGDVDLEAVHGIPWKIPSWHWAGELGMTFEPPSVVIPMYNPAFALHDDEAHTLVATDLEQVARTLRGEVAPREIRDQYPDPVYTVGFVSYPHPNVYVDTEGFPGAPWCLSYSCVPGRAHVILARDKEGLRKFQKWLSRRKRVTFHSAMYDLEICRDMGVYVREDQLHDTKVKAYVTGIEPQGLKALGFRHAGMVMDSYDDITEPYDFCQAFEYLEKVVAVDWGKPDPVFELRNGKPYVKRPQPLHTRVRAIFTSIAKEEFEEGKPVNPRKRWFKIEPDIRFPAEVKLGPMPDFSLDLLPLEDAVNYAGRDADATNRIDEPLSDLVLAGKHGEVYATDITALPMVDRMQSNGMMVKPGYFPKLESFFQREMDKIRKEIESYNRGKFINPNSPPQTAALLFGRLRLPVSKLTPKRQPSTADKVLESLRGRHPAVGLICDWRELATLKDKFANKLPLFIGPDGRVRGKIRDTTVVSGRYSMSEPNLMAIPVRTKVGKKIRMGFIPGAPDRLLGTADLDQIEMRVMADLSGDADMILIFIEGRDIHSENAAMMFGVTLKEVETPEGKLLYRYPAKRIGFGIITGITELGLYDQYRLAGISKYSVKDCADHIQMFFKARPGILRFLNATRQQAIRDGYVREKGGRIRYLPGVYSSHPAVREEALRQSHSHVISGTAQWIKKRAMARIWDEIKDLPPWECEPLLEIHDEVLMEFKKKREKWVSEMMIRCMVADSHLFKVPIKAKFTSGPTWGHLKD